MTQPTNPDSAVEAGKQAPPTPALSSPSSGQPNSGQAPEVPVDLDALVDKLVAHPKLSGQLTKMVQSVKDKRFDQVEKVKAYLDAHGGDAEKAKREMVLDEMVASFGQGNPGTVDPAQNGQSSFQAATARRLEKLGLSFDDPEVVALSKRTDYKSEMEYLDDLSSLAVARAKGQAPAPLGAIVPDGSGGRPAISPDRDTQRDQLTARMMELQKNPSTNFKEIETLKGKLRDLLPKQTK